MKISFSIYKNSLQKIYLQLYEALKRCIETSELKANEKLPSVRQIAIKFDINILTVLKAYDLLEKNNYIYKVRGKGCFVKEKEILSSRNQKPILSNFATLNHKINFASATPSSTTYPLQIFQSLMEESFQTYGSSIFNYFDSQGMLELRQCIQKYLQEKQIYTKSQNIQIISGSQQRLDLIKKTLIKRKNPTMVVGDPTYYGTIHTFSEDVKMICVPLEKDGMNLFELEKILQNHKVDFLYTMINFESPTGIVWSEEKKKQLLELASKYNFLIPEDDCLSDLYYYNRTVCPLKAMDKEERVIYLHSFSKTIMPGLRLGYMILPAPIISEMVAAKFSTDISNSGLFQFALYLFIERGYLKRHLEYLRKHFQKKLELILHELQNIENISITYKTTGGFYLWIQLPKNISSNFLYNILQEREISVLPGSVFSLQEEENHYIRISFASVSEHEIKTGIHMFKTTLEELLSGKKIPLATS